MSHTHTHTHTHTQQVKQVSQGRPASQAILLSDGSDPLPRVGGQETQPNEKITYHEVHVYIYIYVYIHVYAIYRRVSFRGWWGDGSCHPWELHSGFYLGDGGGWLLPSLGAHSPSLELLDYHVMG